MEQLVSMAMHIPVRQWPTSDQDALAAALKPGDIFDGGGGAASHLSFASRQFLEMTYGRWLGFLRSYDEAVLHLSPTERINALRVHAYFAELSSGRRASSVHNYLGGLLWMARLIDPAVDWNWLMRIRSRVAAGIETRDRFDRLVPPWETLDLGLGLMDQSDRLRTQGHHAAEIQYRDGLLIALLSLWPIRRRSLAGLTISAHLERTRDSITFLLAKKDTKARRALSYKAPDLLVPYVNRYLDEIRPRLVGKNKIDSLWASSRGSPLSPSCLYESVRRRILAAFGRDMCLHDFRRAAATFIAMEVPEKVGLIPGTLQHNSPVSQRDYNLARSSAASMKYTSLIIQKRRVSKGYDRPS